jgi:hypothetical protein
MLVESIQVFFAHDCLRIDSLKLYGLDFIKYVVPIWHYTSAFGAVVDGTYFNADGCSRL